MRLTPPRRLPLAALAQWLLVLALTAGLAPAPALAQRRAPATSGSLAELTAQVLRTTRAYRATLERAVPVQEAQVREAFLVLDEGKRLQAAGAVAASYVEQAERNLAAAQRDLTDTLAALEETDRILGEASLQQRLASLPPLPRGGFEDSAMLVRFGGWTPWSLADVPALSRRFAGAFGHPLPISALGQTKVHDRLGLDHRGALDVGVHPDSAEGRWLMDFLRRAGIPFIGIRGEVAGSATGAHVHVGPPSPRLVSGR
jgi:hypothetical protein